MADLSQGGFDPNIIMGLAALARAMDPKGVGGALGGLAEQMQGNISQTNMMQRALGSDSESPNMQGQSGITGGDIVPTAQGQQGGNKSSTKPGSITLSDDGTFKMTGDRSELKDMMGGGQQQQQPQQLTNPFATRQPNISLKELAGLNKEDISQMVSLMLGSQDLSRRTAADLVSAEYKMGSLGVAQDELAIKREAASAPLPQSPIRGMPLATWKTLSSGEQEYQLNKQRIAESGGKIPTRQEYKSQTPTEKMKTLKAIGGPEGEELLTAASKLANAEQRPQDPLRRPLVTWTTATNELTKRFGKLDPTGMWAVTPELQIAHSKAQEYLVELKNSGVEPLEAVNKANERARNWLKKVEKNYFNRLSAAERRGDDELVKHIQSQFNTQFGYTPSGRR